MTVEEFAHLVEDLKRTGRRAVFPAPLIVEGDDDSFPEPKGNVTGGIFVIRKVSGLAICGLITTYDEAENTIAIEAGPEAYVELSR
jgi:hypothetical protein